MFSPFVRTIGTCSQSLPSLDPRGRLGRPLAENRITILYSRPCHNAVGEPRHFRLFGKAAEHLFPSGAPTSPDVTPPSKSSSRKPNLGSLAIVKSSLLEVLLRITNRLPLLRSSSKHWTAPGNASLPSCLMLDTRKNAREGSLSY